MEILKVILLFQVNTESSSENSANNASSYGLMLSSILGVLQT